MVRNICKLLTSEKELGSGWDWFECGSRSLGACMQIALKNTKIMLLRQIYEVIEGFDLRRRIWPEYLLQQSFFEKELINTVNRFVVEGVLSKSYLLKTINNAFFFVKRLMKL